MTSNHGASFSSLFFYVEIGISWLLVAVLLQERREEDGLHQMLTVSQARPLPHLLQIRPLHDDLDTLLDENFTSRWDTWEIKGHNSRWDTWEIIPNPPRNPQNELMGRLKLRKGRRPRMAAQIR